MINIRVEFMGAFDLDFQTTSLDLPLESPATIETLLRALACGSAAGRCLRDALTGEDSLRRRYVLVSVDYVVLPPEDVLAIRLHEAARVCFATPMVGG